ncbi:MAG: hypothetical protein COS89_08900, partial [Deltaproteobacteria bacterium CG07_land_8_20_14_0_80_38_7]
MNNLIYAINYLNEHSVDGNTVLEHSNANEAEAFEELVNQGMDDRYTADGQITLPELAGSLYRLHNPSMLFSEPPETGFTRLSEIEHSFLQSFATFQSEDVSSFGFEQASGIFLENISRISQHQDREIIARFAARQIIEECRNHRTQTDGQSARINLLLSMRTLIFPVLEEEFTHNPNADFAAVFLREMNHYDDIQTTRFLITLSYNMQGSYANRNAVDIHRFVTGVLGVRLRDVLQHHNNEQIELIVSAMVVACTSRSLEVSALANDVLRVLPDEYLNILGDILLSSCSRSVRVASALILGRHGRAGLPFLARVLSRPNAVPIEVYAAALRSLENVEGHDVMPHLR